MLGPQEPILRVGGGESLCYMERLSPLSENKDLPLGMPTSDLCLSSSTDRAGAQGGQVALFGITDIALRCSGTLKMTLSQPGQADPATILSRLISLMAADLPSLSGPGLEADWREKAGKESVSISTLIIQRKTMMQERGPIHKHKSVCVRTLETAEEQERRRC